MKVIRQFALIVAVLLPLVTPSMACALPGARLTPAERACCKHMTSECGHMQMPAAHGCCQKEPPIIAQWNGAQLPTVHFTAPLIAADFPFVARLQSPSDVTGVALQHDLTLPQSPPIVISILRI